MTTSETLFSCSDPECRSSLKWDSAQGEWFCPECEATNSRNGFTVTLVGACLAAAAMASFFSVFLSR